MRNWKKEILSIPNILSLFRLLLIPVYTVLFLRAERPVDYWWAAGILAVSTLTDMVDGKIARRFHMVTNLGKILDPVADKATQCTLLVCLAGESLLLLGSWLTYSWGNTNISFHSTSVMVAAILSFGLYATLITGDIVFSDKYKHNTLKNDHPGPLPQRVLRGLEPSGVPMCAGHAAVLCGLLYGVLWEA